MFGLRRGNTQAVYGALIDIGSGTVGVGIVFLGEGSTLPELIYTHRTVMRITEHTPSREVDLRRIREALISATLILSQDGLEALRKHNPKATITELFVTCASPWSHTLVRNVRYENETPLKITEAIVNDLIETAESEMIAQIHSQTNLKADALQIVEQTTVDVAVNDYPVLNPLNMSGSTVSLSHVVGVIPKEIKQALEEVQDKLFPDTTLHIHTSLLAMHCVIRELFPRIQDCVIVDVTGEATECGLVSHGSFIESISVPQGSISLTRSILAKTRRPLGDIQTHLRAYGDGETSESEFEEDIREYETQIRAVVTQVQEHKIFPTNIIITAYRPYTSFFSRIITRAITDAGVTKPTIHTIEPSLIDTISHGVGDDVYLALFARFFHKVHSSK